MVIKSCMSFIRVLGHLRFIHEGVASVVDRIIIVGVRIIGFMSIIIPTEVRQEILVLEMQPWDHERAMYFPVCVVSLCIHGWWFVFAGGVNMGVPPSNNSYHSDPAND